MKKTQKKLRIPSKYILFAISGICIMLMLASATLNISGGPLYSVASTIFTPMQNGINAVGRKLVLVTNNLKSKQELIAENEALKEQITSLEEELYNTILDVYELENLKELYEIDQEYEEYEKIGAKVIASDSSNFFTTFIINKGSEDGIKENMNVLAGNGLVGIVTEVSSHSATVKSIISDNSNVSAMVLGSSDHMVVSGNLYTMNENSTISFSQLRDDGEYAQVGSSVVTSYISDRYLPGLLIGYISEIHEDNNQLTKSGTITPAVDFTHVEDVLVILELKQDTTE